MKRKREKLTPDLIADANAEYIKQLGGVVTGEDIAKLATQKAMKQYLTHEATYADAVEKTKRYILSTSTGEQMFLLLCANNWYYSGRQVYRFDDTLSETLSSQTKDDMEVDADVIEQLPCNNFYVMRNFKDNEGFFVTTKLKDDRFDLIFSEVDKNGFVRTSFAPLERGKTIKQTFVEMAKSEGSLSSRPDFDDAMNKATLEVSEKLQYVIYLSATNAEIAPATKGAVVRKTAVSKTNPNPSKTKTEISNVGYRVGSAIRKAKESTTRTVYIYDKETEHKGTPKSPHLRRSHFHSFWTGSGSDKKLVVKWVNTIFVNSDKEDDIVTTVHNVK